MFRFITKSALAGWIWKRYKRGIVSTLALFLAYFLIAMIHGDYVDYANSASDKSFLFTSYILKWGALLGVTALYYVYNSRVIAKRSQSEPINDTPRRSARDNNSTDTEPTPDPFADIRRKKTLKSRADRAMDQHKKTPPTP